MGLFFIWFSLSSGFIFTVLVLHDIKIELRWRNRLLEKQNEILKQNNANKKETALEWLVKK